MQKILIATTNQGKMKEIVEYLKNDRFDFVSLNDIDTHLPAPEETGETLFENAWIKAKYYAENTGYTVLAEDTGFFVEALDGFPGVKAARVADTDEQRCDLILTKMQGKENRNAYFQTVFCFYDPTNGLSMQTRGETHGKITEQKVSSNGGFGYDPIFFVPEKEKTYAEMSVQEKNEVSHRTKSLSKIKEYISRIYSMRHMIVPIALVIKDSKVLMILRNDPFAPRFHKKWEFPGGKLDEGEQVESCIIREVKEETGFDVEVVKVLGESKVVTFDESGNRYQAILIPSVCKYVGGEQISNDEEVLEMKWFDIDEVLLQKDLIEENDELYERLLPEVRAIIEKMKERVISS